MSAIPNALPSDFDVHWYKISRVLGHGGFGITYLALDTNLDQAVAIKEYLPGSIATRGPNQQVLPLTSEHATDYAWGLERFISEGRTLARFDHPAVVRVLSVFEAHGTAYLVMRFERGGTLGAALKDKKTLPEDQLVNIFEACLDGLETVHKAGFIHRDIKPPNIYLRDGGGAVLIDFGSARQAMSEHTQTLTTLVSPGYAPFEQYQSDGKQQGPWTDIYALAATAYRCVTGVAPLAAVDRGRGILEDKGDPLIPCSELADGAYSSSLLAAIDAGLRFRGDDRPIDIAAWRALMDGAVPASVTAGLSSRVASADPAEIETVVADTVRVPEPAEPATKPEKKRWYRRKRVWLAAVIILLILASGEEPTGIETTPQPAPESSDETSTPTEDITDAVVQHSDPGGTKPHPIAVDNAVIEVPEPAPLPVPEPVPVAPVPEPPPLIPTDGMPDDIEDDLAKQFEAAVEGGDYARAEALVRRAKALGASPAEIDLAEKSIVEHRELSEVIELVQSHPHLLPAKRVKQAIERAGKAMDNGRPSAATAIAKRLRREFARKARRKRR